MMVHLNTIRTIVSVQVICLRNVFETKGVKSDVFETKGFKRCVRK